MPPGKFPAAINVRADGDSKIRTRPGYVPSFSTGGKRITDMRAYSALGTDNRPRIIVHDSGGGVYLDDGALKGTVGSGGTGASVLAYRPNQSPQSWMYVANATGYKKFSAPDASNNVTARKVGIAEPQSMPEACPDGFQYNEFTALAANWAQAGTAGAPVDVTRSTDTVIAIFQDPASVSPASKVRYSVQVGTTIPYQIGETLTFNKSSGGTVSAAVEDVYPPINGGTALTIQSIYYFAGTAGNCVIVPSQLPVGPVQTPPNATIPDAVNQLAGLRRGSLVKLNGSEVVLVLNVTVGPQHQIAFECSTVSTHVAGETIVGVPAIACAGISSLVVGQTAAAAQINSVITKGIGTLTQVLGTNPFNLSLGTIGTPQEDDLLHVSFTTDIPANITELKILFDVGDGSFTQNILYFSVSSSVLQAAVTNAQTQVVVASQLTQNSAVYQAIYNSLINAGYSTFFANIVLTNNNKIVYDPTTGKTSIIGASGNSIELNVPVGTGAGQYTEVTVSIASLIRIGNDQTKTLANCNRVQILANISGNITLGFGSVWVGGGGQPDVGANGSPYFYRLTPRSSTTGATGNPSPATRYGVLPRVQKVIVSLPSAGYDTQIDTWDIERYGGSVTSWRYIGSAPSSATTFTDNVLDSAALAGSELEFDNFEPWPTVDVPWIATVATAGITSISVYGTAIVVLGPSTAFLTTTLRWLPGTLLTLDGQSTYTLWNRPTAIAGGVLFRILENAGSPSVSTLVVNEPIVANQPLPYLWGPDANGVVFGCGDPLRPGVLYSAKQLNPDATPNNVYDLSPPSEPLLGGEIVDGLSLVASSRRWWQLQPAFTLPQRWLPIETPAGRGLAAPFGHCTDGKSIYFWAKDGICAMVPGLPAIALTDADLANLFPRDGVPGKDVTYAGYTFYAPDYSRAAQFRLSIINSILRAHYYDSNGNARLIVCDLQADSAGQPRLAWSADFGPDALTTSCQPEQPPGSLASVGISYAQAYFADAVGKVYTESDLSNDNGVAIACALGVPEWNADDARIPKQWLDAMVDAVPAGSAGILVTPASGGVAVGTPAAIAQGVTRLLSVVPLGNPLGNFLGVILSWSDNFLTQSVPTTILEWSPEFVAQPLLIRSWKSVPTSHGIQGYHHIRKIVFAYLTQGVNPVTLTISATDGTSPAVLSLPGTGGLYQKVEFVPTFNKGLLFTYQGACPDAWAPIEQDCEIHVGAWERSGPYSVFTGLGGREAV